MPREGARGRLRKVDLRSRRSRGQRRAPHRCYPSYVAAGAEADPERLEELELLFEVTAAISRAEDVADVHHLALAAVARASDAERVAILISDARGAMRFAASRGLTEAYQRAVEGHSPPGSGSTFWFSLGGAGASTSSAP